MSGSIEFGSLPWFLQEEGGDSSEHRRARRWQRDHGGEEQDNAIVCEFVMGSIETYACIEAHVYMRW